MKLLIATVLTVCRVDKCCLVGLQMLLSLLAEGERAGPAVVAVSLHPASYSLLALSYSSLERARILKNRRVITILHIPALQ